MHSDGVIGLIGLVGTLLGLGSLLVWAATRSARIEADRLRRLGDNLPDSAVYQYMRRADGSTQLLYISAGIERLTGISVAEALRDASVLFECFEPEWRSVYAEAEARSARELSDFDVELPMRRRDGQQRWMRLRSRPRRLPDAQVVWDGVQTDVTEVKLGQQALRFSDERARQAVAVARLGVFEVDHRSDAIYWSPRLRDILGWGEHEPPSRQGYRALIPPEQRDAFIAAIRHAEDPAGDGVYEAEHQVLRRDGQLRWLNVRGRVTFEGADGARRPLRTIGATADITAAKLTEQALRASERRLRLYLESAPAALAIFDASMCYLAVSRRWMQDYQLVGNVVGRSHYEVFADLPPAWKEAYRRALTGAVLRSDGDRFERADGRVQWIKWEVHPWYTAGAEIGGVMITSEDITEQKRAEEHFRQVVEGAPNAMVMVDPAGRIALVNTETERLFGYPREELIGAAIETLVPHAVRTGHNALRTGFMSTPSRRAMGFGRELHGRRKDGSEVAVEIGLNPIETAEGRFVLAAIVDITERIRLQDELRQANADLEQRVEARTHELAEKALQLENASRVKSEFLANMSHELRTPLNSMLILSQLLAENAAGNLTDRQVMYARTAHDAGKDLLALIDDILDLAKIEAGRVELDVVPYALAVLCEEMGSLVRPLADARQLDFTLALDPAVPQTLETDPHRLRQIIKNLLSNAIKFTEQGSVRLEIAPARAGWPAGHAQLDSAPQVIALAVQDSGIGIAPDKRALIFEAFRQADGSTARQYGGTGLGLAISSELTRLLGGALTVQSEPGAGSRFTLWLPSVHAGPRAPARHAPAEDLPLPGALPRTGARQIPAEAEPAVLVQTGEIAEAAGAAGAAVTDAGRHEPADAADLAGRTVLLVDDDMRNLFALTGMLEQYGLVVVVAESGQEALDRLADHGGIELVLMDIMMPGMDGYEATRTIRADARHADLPVIALTAKAMTGDREKCLQAGANDYLSKPVEPDRLLGLLRVWLCR
jgi:PAS domain S-box-containing protein